MIPALHFAVPESGGGFRRAFRLLMIWILGGAIYCACEFFWRGYSHMSMFVVGGMCVVLIGEINCKLPQRLGMLPRALVGAFVITSVELASGILLNVQMGLHVWDYSAMPLNLWGQICPQYSVVWVPMSAAAISLYNRVR